MVRGPERAGKTPLAPLTWRIAGEVLAFSRALRVDSLHERRTPPETRPRIRLIPVEFLAYKSAAPMLTKQGIVEHQEGDLLRFSVNDKKGVTRRMVIGAPDELESGDDAIRKIDAPKERLPEIAEGIVHRLHFQEAALIPVSRWQDVLDVAAFDLATDERWLDIDAEAAMHQKGRDPLLILPDDRHLIATIVKAIMTNGESARHDLTLTSFDAPFLMRVRYEGALSVWCANDAVADMVRGVAK